MNEQTPNQRDVTAPRPNPAGRWRCGFESMGMACSAGPTVTGECCQVAARAACAAGGNEGCETRCSGASTCEISKLRPESLRVTGDDLHNCMPTKAAWFSRQTLTLNLAILCGGVLLSCMALSFREAAFVPGKLTEPHAQILGNRLISDRCSLCHPSSHAGAFTGADGRTQDDLCMQCHSEHMPDAAMRSPHDLQTTMIDVLRANSQASSTENVAQLIGWTGKHQPVKLTETSCAMCHVEHRGPHHDLKQMSDARCQACHQDQFAGFGDGHPEFADFPYHRERQIAFDHASHASRHFAQKSESFDCGVCHVDTSKVGSVGEVFRSVGYEQACARCHDASIRAGQSDGWIVFQLPSIEEADASQPELGLNDWPTTARFGYDGIITMPTAWLLYGDPAAREALRRIGGDGQLSNIDTRDTEDVEAARVIARSMRKLVRRIADEGQVAWADAARLAAEQVLERELAEHELLLIQRLASGMPPDLFRQIELRWFQLEGKLVQSPSTSKRKPARLTGVRLGADDSQAGSADDSLLLDWTDDELIVDPPTSDELLPSDDARTEIGGALEDGSFDSADDLLFGHGEGSNETLATTRPLSKLTGAKHVPQGGWYLDEELLAVRYMPTGHADPLLSAWTEFSIWMSNAAGAKAGTDADRLPACVSASINRMTPGNCVECHLVATGTAASGQQAWQAVLQPVDVKPFTKFNHGPHLTLPLVRDCRYCHVIHGLVEDGIDTVVQADYSPTDRKLPQSLADIWSQHQSSSTLDAHAAVSRHLSEEFQGMQQSQCTACHRPGGADSGCTQCHNYHVGSSGFEWSRTTK